MSVFSKMKVVALEIKYKNVNLKPLLRNHLRLCHPSLCSMCSKHSLFCQSRAKCTDFMSNYHPSLSPNSPKCAYLAIVCQKY